MIRAAAGIFRQAACPSGDVGQTLHRLTFPGSSPGTLAETRTVGLSPPAPLGTLAKTRTACLSPPALRGRRPKPAPPDFPRPPSGDAGRNLHRRTLPACSPGTSAKTCTVWLRREAERCQGGSFVKIEQRSGAIFTNTPLMPCS